MRKRKQHPIPARNSPKNSSRACLCADGTYSRSCCDGSLIAQGIGNITGVALPLGTVTHNRIPVTHNGINVTHNG